ncbi:hypothetical protein [Synechococcus sp. PCC 7335]|uniref:hypothetical protein n=1 Tax=Synechococcus sp. (strain ATCC 29403 / PCC 7335) TaxID=91464 RepID=UPI0002FBB0B2|nr:hypothetical protein [Synechococcus sp. PCC 7335]
MSPLAQQVVEEIEALPEVDQKQILDFVKFLKAKRQQAETQSYSEEPKSFAEVARASIGAVNGPGDLATNPAYMEGYGQ